MKGIILVLGRVTEVFWVGFGGFWGVFGVLGGSKGVSWLYPQRTLFAILKSQGFEVQAVQPFSLQPDIVTPCTRTVSVRFCPYSVSRALPVLSTHKRQKS